MQSRKTPFATFVFVSAAAFAGLALLYVGLHWERLLTSSLRAIFFAGGPIAGIVLSLAALRLSAEKRLVLALTMFSVGIGLYGFEFYATFFPSHGSKADPKKPGFDTREKYQVVRDYRAKAIRAYPAVFPEYLLQTQMDGNLRSPIALDNREILPLGGIPGVLTVLCNESGTYVVYDSDERGFNNPSGLWDKENIATAVLGDSFAQGYCVKRRDSFAGLIHALYGPSLNLGTSGSGPLLMLASLKEFLPAFRPSDVLWFFFEGNDIPGNLAIERRSPLLMRYLKEPGFRQNLASVNKSAAAALAAYIDALVEKADNRRETDAGSLQTLISFIGLANVRRALRFPSSLGKPDYELLQKIAKSARDTAASWDGRLHLVYLPTFPSALADSDSPSESNPLNKIHTNVKNMAQALDIPFIDIKKAFQNHSDPASLFPFRSPGHYNEAGHKLVAQTVIDALTARKEIKP
jgi:hypothetical protein